MMKHSLNEDSFSLEQGRRIQDMYQITYVVCPLMETAEMIAKTLVTEHLAACVNIFPVQSVYHWEGSLMQDQEVVILIKSKKDLEASILERVYSLHPYDTPCIVNIPITSGDPHYLAWLEASLSN